MQGQGLRCRELPPRAPKVRGTQLEVSGAGFVLTVKSRTSFSYPTASKPR